MKKLVLAAVVLAAVFGVSGTTNAFWGFSKKANKAEVKNEQAENNMAAATSSGVGVSFAGESKDPKIAIESGVSGKAIIGGAKVKTIADSNGVLTASVVFGTSGPVFDLTIKTNPSTKVYRRYQDSSEKFVSSSISNIAVDDVISINGTLDTSVTTGFTVVAGVVKDYSLQAKDTNYSGTIKTSSINVANKTFTISLSGGGEIGVSVYDATKITINGVNKSFSDLMNGMFVVGASGIVNTNTKKLDASFINITTAKTIVGRIMAQQVAVVDSVNAATKTMVIDVAGMKYNVFTGLKMQGPDVKIGNQYIKRGFFKLTVVNSVLTSVQVNTFAELNLAAGDKVWITGELGKTTSTNQVDAYRIEKSFLSNSQ